MPAESRSLFEPYASRCPSREPYHRTRRKEAPARAGSRSFSLESLGSAYLNIEGSSSRTTSAWSQGNPALRACSKIDSALGASYSQ